MRVVLDCNVAVSAARSRGVCGAVIVAAVRWHEIVQGSARIRVRSIIVAFDSETRPASHRRKCYEDRPDPDPWMQNGSERPINLLKSIQHVSCVIGLYHIGKINESTKMSFHTPDSIKLPSLRMPDRAELFQIVKVKAQVILELSPQFWFGAVHVQPKDNFPDSRRNDLCFSVLRPETCRRQNILNSMNEGRRIRSVEALCRRRKCQVVAVPRVGQPRFFGGIQYIHIHRLHDDI